MRGSYQGTLVLETRIPEQGGAIAGLVYGAHVSMVGRAGYYVRLEGTEEWYIAQLTPASDELYGTDAEIVDAIRDEIAQAIRSEITEAEHAVE
jgi:hypothetical protein